MTRGCSVPACGRSPAKKSSCCGLRLCETHAATSTAHSCPAQARLLAMTPAECKRALAQNAPESRLTFQAAKALNLLPGVRVAAFDSGGARQRNTAKGEPGTPDIMGRSKEEPWAIPIAVETKNSHKDGCSCDSCSAQREWGAALMADGGVYVLARTVQQAVDGVRMGLARARGPRAHDRVRCLRCGHVWESRLASGQIPKQCGLCLSPSAGENGETMIVAVARDAERSAG